MQIVTELYKHQQAAVDKLSKIKVGALYMEQGTGKTRTTLELIRRRLLSGKVDKALWLCPCSVKRNLQEDITFHCGEFPAEIMIAGIESLSSSDKLYLELLKMLKDGKGGKVYLIVDESNLVKNIKAKRTERIINLSQACKYKLILNGTPASRNEADMFAQWYILDWRILGYKTYWGFANNHLEFKRLLLPNGREVVTNKVQHVLNIDYLTEKIAPYTYQILKSECLDLPKKHYHSCRFNMTPEQRETYEAVKTEYLYAVDELKPETIYKLFTALQHVVSGRRVLSSPNKRMETKTAFANLYDNPRILKLLEIIDEEIGEEQCIIFAKYQTEIQEISQVLTERGKGFRMFTGKVTQTQRQENIEAFRKGVQFLLANKQCGAYGLNLQFCRNIIYYSNDFDLATRLQSEDRVHRIGQNQEVHIYDIYTPDTIDDFIQKCLGRKENMVDAFKREIKRLKNETSLHRQRRTDGGA